MEKLLGLANTKENTFVMVPQILLCVSWILSKASVNKEELENNGLKFVNFNIESLGEMAEKHPYYYKRQSFPP